MLGSSMAGRLSLTDSYQLTMDRYKSIFGVWSVAILSSNLVLLGGLRLSCCHSSSLHVWARQQRRLHEIADEREGKSGSSFLILLASNIRGLAGNINSQVQVRKCQGTYMVAIAVLPSITIQRCSGLAWGTSSSAEFFGIVAPRGQGGLSTTAHILKD